MASELTSDFSFEDVDERDEKSASRPEATRQELANWLKKEGLSEPEVEIVLLKAFERKSLRVIAGEVRLGKTTVSRVLKSAHVERVVGGIEAARNHSINPETLTPDSSDKPQVFGKTLREIKAWAIRELSPDSEEFSQTTLREWESMRRESPWLRSLKMASLPWGDYSHYSPTITDMFRIIRTCPALLLKPSGAAALEFLVDFLEAAQFGTCGFRRMRRPPKISRESLRNHTAKVLHDLVKPSRGQRYPFLDMSYGWVVHAYGNRIYRLQAEWQKHLGKTRRWKLARFRQDFPEDAQNYSDAKLAAILTGDVIKAAARVAEEDTGVSAELLERGYLKRFRGFDPFAPRRTVPPYAINPPL